MHLLGFLANILTGISAGIIIGFERQWQKRLVGIRTTALVCFGACMFVTLSTLIEGDGSPTRVAAQVVSGIGFLAGGVIIRDGYSVSGINTAATLWCSAAVGAIIGAGFRLEGIICAFILMAVNVILRSVSRKVDFISVQHRTDIKHYHLAIVCSEAEEINVRTIILTLLNQLHLNFNHIICGEEEDGKVTILVDLEINEREPTVQLRINSLVEKLLLERVVLEVQRIGMDMTD